MDSVERYRQHRARKHRLMPAESLRELRNTLTEAEMQQRYNAFMEATTRPINRDAQMRYLARAQIYAEELMRRETVRLAERMQRLIVTLAVLVILATIMSVILSTLTLSLGELKQPGRLAHLPGLLENEAAKCRSRMLRKGRIVGSTGGLRSRTP
jgi:hypothetical protein